MRWPGASNPFLPGAPLFLAAGLTGLFLTGDAFNFYVFFEIAMVSSYILVAYGEERRQLRAAVIFAVVNLLGSVLFLMGIVSLYHVTGTLDMAASPAAWRLSEQNPSLVAGTLLFVALGVKLGIFPFHFWLPAVYTGVHASVAAMLSGALATIGAYGLLRIGAGMLPRVLALSAPVFMVLGVASIVYGGVQAVSRHDPSAVIAYSSIGQVGYILIAVAIGGNVGFAAAILFTVVNSANKTLLFLAGDQSSRTAGLAYAIGGLSVAGIPIALGFWSKAALLQGAMVADEVWQAYRAHRGDRGRWRSLDPVYVPVIWTNLLARLGGVERFAIGAISHGADSAAGGSDTGAWALARAADCAERSRLDHPHSTEYAMRMVLGTALLTLVYCLALASANPWDIALGAVFGFPSCFRFANSCSWSPRRRLATSCRAAFIFRLLWRRRSWTSCAERSMSRKSCFRQRSCPEGDWWRFQMEAARPPV